MPAKLLTSLAQATSALDAETGQLLLELRWGTGVLFHTRMIWMGDMTLLRVLGMLSACHQWYAFHVFVGLQHEWLEEARTSYCSRTSSRSTFWLVANNVDG